MGESGEGISYPMHAEVRLLEQMAGLTQFESGQCTTTTTTTSTTSTSTSTASISTVKTTQPGSVPVCTMPVANDGTYSLQLNHESTWQLVCDVGFAFTTGNNVVSCAAGVFSPTEMPQCEASTATCPMKSILQNTVSIPAGDLVDGTTCTGTDIATGVTCQAICKNNVSAVGDIKCLRGTLTDYSYCISKDSTVTVETATNMHGGIGAETELAPSSDVHYYAFCGALISGQSCQLVTGVTSAPTGSNRRLIDVDELEGDADGRRLGVIYNINYTVSIPSTSTVNSSKVLEKAKLFGEPNSTVIQAFIAAARVKGMEFSNIVETHPVMTTTSVIVKDADGNIISPLAPPPAPHQGATEESSILLIAIGGALGGMFGAVIIGILCYWYFVLRKKAEA